MEYDNFSVSFNGKLADHNALDLYDAADSYKGLARVLSIMGHYYENKEIIYQAPRSSTQILIIPAKAGSFWQDLLIGVTSAVVSVPFTVLATKLFDKWLPSPDPQLAELIKLQKEQNQLLRKELDLPREKTREEKHQEIRVEQFIEENQNEFDVIRSVVSHSMKDVFRPIGRSADTCTFFAGKQRLPIATINEDMAALLQSEIDDDKNHTILGVVNSFSRTSKTGTLFSSQYGRGFLFAYKKSGNLPGGDIFSWSQYSRKEIYLTGYFTKFFDGRYKRFIVIEASRSLKE